GHVTGVQSCALPIYGRAMCHELFPILLLRAVGGRGHDAIVFTALIRPDVEEVAAMVCEILVILLSRRDNFQFVKRVVARNVTDRSEERRVGTGDRYR